MNDTKRIAKVTLIGLVAAVLALSAAASLAAVDAKMIPGAACRSVTQSTQDDVDYSGTSGNYITRAGGTGTVDCPLITDYPSQTALSSLEVYVKPGTSGDVTCTHTCTDTSGTALESHSYTTSGTSAQTLTWSSGYLDGCEEQNFWRVYCGLGNGAKVYGVKWGEIN